MQKSQVHIDSNENSQRAQGQNIQTIEHSVTFAQSNQNERPSKNTKKGNKKQYKQQDGMKHQLELNKETEAQLQTTKGLFFHVSNLIEQTACLNVEIELRRNQLKLLKIRILKIQQKAREIYEQRDTLDWEIIQKSLEFIENQQAEIRQSLEECDLVLQKRIKSLEDNLQNKGKSPKQIPKLVKQTHDNLSSQILNNGNELDEMKKQVSKLRGMAKSVKYSAQLIIDQSVRNRKSLQIYLGQMMGTIADIINDFREMML